MRASVLKLYADNKSLTNNLKHYDLIEDYSFYIYDSNIISNTHLMTFKNLDYPQPLNLQHITCEIVTNILKVTKIPKISILKDFNLYNSFIKTNITLNKSHLLYDISLIIGLIDILSRLNSIELFFTLNKNLAQIDIEFRIKYITFIISYNSIKNISKEIRKDNKHLFSNDDFIIMKSTDKLIVNKIFNLCKYMDYLKTYNKDFFNKINDNDLNFKSIIEIEFGKSFDDIKLLIDDAIKSLINIIKSKTYLLNGKFYIESN